MVELNMRLAGPYFWISFYFSSSFSISISTKLSAQILPISQMVVYAFLYVPVCYFDVTATTSCFVTKSRFLIFFLHLFRQQKTDTAWENIIWHVPEFLMRTEAPLTRFCSQKKQNKVVWSVCRATVRLFHWWHGGAIRQREGGGRSWAQLPAPREAIRILLGKQDPMCFTERGWHTHTN